MSTPEAEAKRPRTRVRRFLRGVGLGLLGLAGLALLGVAGTTIWLRTEAGNDFIRRQLDGAVDLTMKGGDFQVGELSTDLFTTWQLDDLALVDERGREVAVIEQVRLSLRPLALFSGTLHLEEVALVGVHADLRRDDEGVLDVQRLFGLGGESSSESSPWEGLPVDVELERFSIEGSSFALGGDEPQASLSDIELVAAASVVGPVVRVEGIDLGLHAGVPELRDVGATGSVVYDGERVLLDELAIDLGEGQVVLGGEITGLMSTPELAVTLRAEPFDLAPIDAFADAGLGGQWQGELAVTGPLASTRIDGRLDGVNGSEGGLALDLEVDLTSADIPWTGTLVAEAFHVEDAVGKVGEDPLVVSGTLSASGQGTQFPEGIAATGQFEGTEVIAYGVVIDQGTAGLEMVDGKLHWRDVVTDGPLGPLNAAGSYDFVDGKVATKLQGRVQLAELERFGATDLGGSARLNLRVSVDTTEEGVPTWVNGRVLAEPFEYGPDVRFERVEADIQVQVASGRTVVDTQLVGSDGVAYGVDIAHYADDNVHVEMEEGVTVATGDGTFMAVAVPSVAFIDEGGAAWRVDLNEEGMRADVHVDHGRHDLLAASGSNGTIDVLLARDVAHVRADLGGPDGPTFQSVLDFDLAQSKLDAESMTVQMSPGSVWAATEPVTLRLAEEGGGVRDALIALSSTDGRLDLVGDVGMAGPLDGEIRARGLDLGVVSALAKLDEPLTGKLSFDLALSGEASDASLDATGLLLEGFDGDIGLTGRIEGYAGALYPHLDATVDGQALVSVGGSLPVSLDLSAPGLNPEGTVDLDLALRAGPLSRLERWAGSQLPPGATSGVIEVDGVLGDPSLRAAGVAELDAAGWRRPARVEWQVTREDADLVYWADVFEGFDRRAALEGTAETQASEIFAWALLGSDEPLWDDWDLYAQELDSHVALRDIPAQSLVDLGGAGVEVGGLLNGTLALSGSAMQPVLESSVRWHGAEFGGATLAHASFDLEHDDGVYSPTVALQFEEAGSFFVGGDMPMKVDLSTDWPTWQTGDLDLALGGDGVPLGVAAAVDPGVQNAEGLLALTGTIGGTFERPKPDLVVGLEDARLDYLPLGLRILDVSFAGIANQHVVSLKSFAANPVPLRRNLKSGLVDVVEGPVAPVTASGTMRIEDWKPAVVAGNLTLNSALVSAKDDQLLRLSGQVDVTERWPELSVDGLLKVEQGFIGLDSATFFSMAPLELDENLVVVRTHGNPLLEQIAEALEDEPPLYEKFDIEVVFDMNRNVEADIVMPFIDDLGALGASVTSANVSVRLDGQGTLALEGGELALLGEVEVLSGRASVLQAKFDLDSGVISFIGDDFTNPALDLTGSMGVSGGEVLLDVGGTPSRPEISFSSEDFPDQQQIFTILLTGRSPDDLSKDQGMAAASAAGGMLLQSVLGGTSFGGFSVEPDGTVSVGVPVAPSVFVRSSFSPAPDTDENNVSVLVEWALARRLVLEAAWGDRHSWGDLFWEVRF